MSQKNPMPLPEQDQVTVNIEMMVSRDKINFLFGLSSNQLGAVVFEHVRSKVGMGSVRRFRYEMQSPLDFLRAVAHRFAGGPVLARLSAPY